MGARRRAAGFARAQVGRALASAAVAGALSLGCGSAPAFECAGAAACDAEGDGRCEPDGRCSYGEPACPSGRRYGAPGSECVAALDGGGGRSSDAGIEADGPDGGGDPEGRDAGVAPDAGPVASGRIAIPGALEGEDYREGGEGVGYHDSTVGNLPMGCRTDDVDLKPVADGNCVIGYWNAGEWVEYEVRVAASGTYLATARVARGAPTGEVRVRLDQDGVEVGAVTVGPTGAWADLVERELRVELTAGDHLLRLTNEGGGLDLDSIRFSGPVP